MKEKVMSYRDVEAKPLPEDMAHKTTIRWLITRADGGENFAMRYFSMEPGGWIKDHSHPWEHEIFIVRGRGILIVDGRRHEVSQGDFIFIPPNASHAYEALGDEPFEFICVIPDKGY